VIVDVKPANKDARDDDLGIDRSENYNRHMTSHNIESLLKTANSSTDSDTSVNVVKRTFLTDDDCAAFFEMTKANLLRIEEWNKNSSVTSYDLFDESGRSDASGLISDRKFIRIALYGSGKYDWVRVLKIVDEPDEFVMTVKPSYDPEEGSDPSLISHFFGPEAENNFCVQRIQKTVAFYVIGLNEKQNTKFTDSLIETARNAAIANIGYYSGLQKSVWKDFAANFLRTDEEKAA
jgi:hypothetical protein